MDNEQEITPTWRNERPKSPVRMALNQNQKNANLQKQIKEMDRSKIRTKRKPSRFFMENEYVHGGYNAALGNSCARIYLVLSVHCNNETQVAFPSITTIQIMSGCTNRNSTMKALSILESYGIIGILKTKGFNMVNVYAFQATQYWKPIPGWKERMEKYRNKSQYQFTPHRSNKREEYRSNSDDTLTNLIDNSSNNITSIGDVIRKMQRLQGPDSVAIQEPSLHSVDGRAKHEPLPVIAGNLREPRSDTSVTTIDQNPTVNKREITADTVEGPPFINGEKWADERINNMGHDPNDPDIKSAYEH